MSDNNKDFYIDFYQGQYGASDSSGLVSDLLVHLEKKSNTVVYQVGNTDFELRNLRTLPSKSAIRGVVAKFRQDNLPHAAAPGEGERELDLNENEGLIEKNHFIFFKRMQLLVWQRNGNGCRPNRLAGLLSDQAGETIAFHPILQSTPMRRMMSGEVDIRRINVRIARPTNRELYKQLTNPWSKDVLQLMADGGGSQVEINLSGNGRSKRREERLLPRKLKRAVRELMSHADVKKAKISVEDEHGIQHPIDLIEDRLSSIQTVTMNGRYPDVQGMFIALQGARDEVYSELVEIFGDDDTALI
ncbi:MAG: DUF6731 family protein [Candidatus Thiodiazotropha endolucinida]